MNLLDRLLPLLTEREMPQQNRCLETKGVHILARSSIHLPRPRQHGTLRLRLGRCHYIRYAHEL